MRIDAPIITGSFSLNGDTFNDLGAYPSTGSNTFVGNQSIVGAVSASALTGSISYANLTNVPTLVSGSEQIVGILSPLNSYTQSNDTTNTTQNTRLSSLENKTGSLATTGSNTFYGQQIFSGSLYVQNNLIVQGSSSLQNITASAVSIGTNIVYLNTDTPAVRFAGLTVQDSGSSAGVTGSMLWDSLCNRWIYSNPSTIGYSGGMLLSGPRASTLGTETTLTCNYVAKSGGGDHLYDSCIIDDGTTTCIKNNLIGAGTINSVGLLTGQASIYQTDAGGLIASNRWGAYNGGSTSMSFLYNASGNVVWDNGTQRMVLSNTGNLGINETTPLAPLHFSKQTTWGSSDNRVININNTGTGGDINQAHNMGSITWYSGNSTPTAEIAAYRNTPASGNNIELRFYTATAGTPLERMRIVSNGCIGIGNTSPNTILHTTIQTCYGTNGSVLNSYPIATFSQCDCAGGARGLQIGVPTGGVNSPVYLKVVNTSARFSILDSSNNEDFTITGGRVGISTSSPNASSPLHVKMCSNSNGDGIRVQAICSGGAGSQPGVAFANTSDCKRWNIAMDSSSDTFQITNAGGSNVFNVTQNCVVCLGPITTIGMQGGADTTVISGGSGYGSAISMKFANGAFNNYLAGNGDNFFNCVTGKLNAQGGIKFGGGSGTLNHYESGTWTPQLYWTGGGYYCMGGINGGNYVRIGNVVHVNYHLQWSALCGSSGFSGQLRIGGLPYVVGGYRSAGTISAISYGIGRSVTGVTYHALTVDPGANFIYWIENDPTGGYTHGPSVGAAGLVYSNQVTYTLQ